MYPIVFYVIFLVCTLDFSNGQTKKFFRKDYTYLEGLDSFYKVHTIYKTWPEAKRACELEEATLFYPKNDNEAKAVISLWKSTHMFSHVFIGISDTVGKGVFETIDGIPIEDVYHKWGPGEPNDSSGIEDCVIMQDLGFLNDDHCFKNFPFICKKSSQSLQWNRQCNMTNLDYKYIKDLNKCYIYHKTSLNWTEANAVCRSEDSYLAIINTQLEADYFELLANLPPISESSRSGPILLGFHNRAGDGWQTIEGTPLEDSGYVRWGQNQPDGGDDEQCGSMLYNGRLDDVSCNAKGYFFCEHDIITPSPPFDIRSKDTLGDK